MSLSLVSAPPINDSELKPRWQKIFSFSLDESGAALPFSMVLQNEMEWTEEFTKTAIVEYKKFAFLSSLFPGKMVPSINVDTVWHLHLLYTRSYQSFCQDALNMEFLHHEPSSGNKDEEQGYRNLYLNTLEVYEKYFAKPPSEIWGGDTRNSS